MADPIMPLCFDPIMFRQRCVAFRLFPNFKSMFGHEFLRLHIHHGMHRVSVQRGFCHQGLSPRIHTNAILGSPKHSGIAISNTWYLVERAPLAFQDKVSALDCSNLLSYRLFTARAVLPSLTIN